VASGAGAPPAEARTVAKEREREQRRLERRVETLEADVAKLEAELATIRSSLASDHAGDWQKLHTLADRERELDELLARRMAEWESASAELAKIDKIGKIERPKA
jgi:ATP-binding cassette subfamily F protein 3